MKKSVKCWAAINKGDKIGNDIDCRWMFEVYMDRKDVKIYGEAGKRAFPITISFSLPTTKKKKV